MKPLYIESDEEVTSVIERLKHEQADSLALVVPRGALLLQSVVNLRLLKRELQKQDKQLVIVTTDRIGRNLASQAGFSVFSELRGKEPINIANDEVEEAPPGVRVHRYQPSEPEVELSAEVSSPPDSAQPPVDRPIDPSEQRSAASPSRAFPRGGRWLLGAIVLSLLLYLPSGTVALTLPSQPFSAHASVRIDANLRASDLGQHALAGDRLTVDLSTSSQLDATGKRDVGRKASGQLTVANRSGKEVALPSGSRFKTDGGLLFVTGAAVTVPAATARVNSNGEAVISPGTAEVAVEAAEGGAQYNISGGTLVPVGVAGVGSGTVSATPKGSLSGGTSEEKTVVAQADIDQLTSKIHEALKSEAESKLNEQKRRGELLLVSAIELGNEKLEIAQSVGSESKIVSGSLTATATTIAFSEEEYRKVVVLDVSENLPSGNSLVLTSDDQIAPGAVKLDATKGVLEIDGQITTKVGQKVDLGSLRGQLRNRSLGSAHQLLSDQFSNVQDIRITTSPSFIPRLPLFSNRIRIKVSYESQTNSQ